MRKTQLWFNKEQTPEFYNPQVTYVGRPNTIKVLKKLSVTGRSKRFTDYDKEAKRLGTQIGPGYYPQFYNCIYATRTKGTPTYKKFFRQRDLTDNWYFSVNQSFN
jgi:hypothetical protein